MQVWFEINGWMKRSEVDRRTFNSGRVRVALPPPLNTMAEPGNEACNTTFVAVDLRYHGWVKNNLRVFEYR